MLLVEENIYVGANWTDHQKGYKLKDFDWNQKRSRIQTNMRLKTF